MVRQGVELQTTGVAGELFRMRFLNQRVATEVTASCCPDCLLSQLKLCGGPVGEPFVATVRDPRERDGNVINLQGPPDLQTELTTKVAEEHAQSQQRGGVQMHTSPVYRWAVDRARCR